MVGVRGGVERVEQQLAIRIALVANYSGDVVNLEIKRSTPINHCVVFKASGGNRNAIRGFGEQINHRRAMQRKIRPDGIICASASMALAVNAGLAKGGLKLGLDFDMVVKSVNPLVHLLLPDIIGIEEDYRKAGFELGKMIMARIAGANAVDLQKIEKPQAVEKD